MSPFNIYVRDIKWVTHLMKIFFFNWFFFNKNNYFVFIGEYLWLNFPLVHEYPYW